MGYDTGSNVELDREVARRKSADSEPSKTQTGCASTMKPTSTTMPYYRVAWVFAGLATLSVAAILGRVFYMLHQGPDNPAVLWCGSAITYPLALAANVLIPTGFAFHVMVLAYAHIRLHRMPASAFVHALIFACLSTMIVSVGARYCTNNLEGASFESLVWWM